MDKPKIYIAKRNEDHMDMKYALEMAKKHTVEFIIIDELSKDVEPIEPPQTIEYKFERLPYIKEKKIKKPKEYQPWRDKHTKRYF